MRKAADLLEPVARDDPSNFLVQMLDGFALCVLADTAPADPPGPRLEAFAKAYGLVAPLAKREQNNAKIRQIHARLVTSYAAALARQAEAADLSPEDSDTLVEVAEAAVKVTEGKDWGPLHALGVGYARAGRKGEAEKTLGRALALLPESPAGEEDATRRRRTEEFLRTLREVSGSEGS